MGPRPRPLTAEAVNCKQTQGNWWRAGTGDCWEVKGGFFVFFFFFLWGFGC